MKASPYEPEAPARATDGRAGQQGDVDVRPEMRASQDTEEEDQRVEDPIDEPGYGHGV